MIKIEINNEEVVCDKNLSIKEEMLSTSSTILKNCYPKSWNDDYNYTRFWFPKDYSKCKITDIDYYPPIIGTRVSGTNLNINYNNELKWDLEQLQGNTVQGQAVTGEQVITIEGKNLFDINGEFSGNPIKYNNGLQFIKNSTNRTLNYFPNQILEAGEYTLSYEIVSSTLSDISNMLIAIFDTDNQQILTSRFGQNKITFTSNKDISKIYFYISNSEATDTQITLDNIQLEKGSTITEYEPYQGKDYEINLGKNLYDISTADYTYKCTLSNGVYTTDTLTSSGRSINFGYRANNNYTIKNGERYYFSADIRLASGNASATNALRFNVSGITNTTISNPTYTNEFQRYVFSSVNNTGSDLTTGRLLFQPTSTNLDNAVFEIKNVMISKSSNSDYVPYITPIELNTEDKIYQEDNKWYIEKNLVVEEITDTNLIEQLNSIELLNGVNNISVSSAYLPASLQIYYNYREESTTEDLLFCGVVKNTGNINLNPREPHYCDLQVLDFKTFLSEGETLNFVINNKTITQAIQQVINAISDYGFVLGNVQVLNPNDLINAYSTLNKTAYDVFQYIADVTQSRWTTRMIDENTVAIDFYDPSLMPQGLEIESTNEFYCQNHIMDISFNYSTMDYRNKQIMTSDEVFSNITQTETLIADGYTKSFMCQNKIGYITKITVNGVNQTVVTKSEAELGVTSDFVYQPGEMTFNSKNTLATGSVIVITYYAIVKGREIILNSSEISRIADQIDRKGVISRYENRNDTLTSNELIKIGQSYIKYKGSAEITLKVVSENNLFNVGEIVNYDSPLEELSTEYMVKSKQIDMYLTANEIVYTYELTSNFNSENAVNYFDNQRAKNQGNLGQGETITRNIDIESTALIQFYDYSIEEVQVGTDTTLDFALDSVLI